MQIDVQVYQKADRLADDALVLTLHHDLPDHLVVLKLLGVDHYLKVHVNVSILNMSPLVLGQRFVLDQLILGDILVHK